MLLLLQFQLPLLPSPGVTGSLCVQQQGSEAAVPATALSSPARPPGAGTHCSLSGNSSMVGELPAWRVAPRSQDSYKT